MRLVCPNCGAQYEVDDNVIPETGRDVQCSNCGHTWFQRPAHMDAELADELDEPPPEDAAFEEPEDDEPAPEPAAEPRGLDPSIANVLREEAEREKEARRAETEGLETQPDLGLEESGAAAHDRSAAARARMARLRGLDDDAEPDAAAMAAAAGARSELLPDIEEINSSLRASEDRDSEADAGTDADDEETRRRRGGFRTGFLLVVLVAAIAAAVYALAPQIARQVPQAEPYLASYVAWANDMRAQVGVGLDIAVSEISDLIARYTNGTGN